MLIARVLLRGGLLARIGAVLGAGLLVVTGALGLASPQPITAARPIPIGAVPRAELATTLRTGVAPNEAIRIAFSIPMDRESVRDSLRLDPPAAVVVDWTDDSKALTVSPLGRWASGTYYTVTVDEGAAAATGRSMAAPVRAAFLTRAATTATIEASRTAGRVVAVDTSIVVDFDRSLDPTTVKGALRIDPVVAGSWKRLGRRTGDRWVFTPLGRLAAGTTYTVSLAGSLRDDAGAAVRFEPLTFRTADPPKVVRVRPANASAGIDRGTKLSIRFSQAMDQAATAAAFSAKVDGKPVKGSISWVEKSTVLVFDPAADFGYGKRVTMALGRSATSAAGVPLAAALRASFTTYVRPAPRAASPTPRSASSTVVVGGSVGSGAWTAVEAYYMRLMNCTRTGGWVTSSGDCSSPGGRDVAPLLLDAGISSKVARPYAKVLATRNACSHFIGGDPGDRLRAAGYTSYTWAENIGCRSGDPYAAVLGSHLFFQSEKSYNGGHYVNLMNAQYTRAGVGVWVYGGRVRLVVDFYRPG